MLTFQGKCALPKSCCIYCPLLQMLYVYTINRQILSRKPFWVLEKYQFTLYSYEMSFPHSLDSVWKLKTLWCCFIFWKYLFWKITYCKIALSDTVVLPLSKILSDKSSCQFCYCERLKFLTASICLLLNVNSNV